MNHCIVQQKTFAACDEMRSSVPFSISDRKDSVVCPKPRRFGLLNHSINDSTRPLRWHISSHQAELSDSKAGAEILDIILTRGGGYGDGSANQELISSSPPYFCGSPPSRAANPLVQDARFGQEKVTPPLTILGVPSSSSPSTQSPARKGCVRTKFGHKPAAVRIEGFDCLDRDRRSCSIPAVA
eukprot:TRINITY_DN630_c0_g2_i1.p1 TRINITY_DN630_c0_g2~~TRINITY_DN630_c0_g2_i1.p1  ORF type:complete len:184 (-),score=9.20 TRINITY_DN630_c0_g2_i1:392-943(-)